MQCDVRHARSILAIAREASLGSFYQHAQIEVTEWEAEHSSVLPALRAQILHRAMADIESDVLLTMDSDTWINGPTVRAALEAMAAWFVRSPPTHAALALVVPQRDGRVNAWQAEGERLSERPDMARPTQVHAIGSAIMFHDLAWYRAQRAGAGVFYAMVASDVGGGLGDVAKVPIYVGEDVWHCAAVRRMGGVIEAIDCGGVHGGAL